MEAKYSEDVRQHLTFIQGVITRMNANAFSMKGWMLAIVSALCAIYAANTGNPNNYIYFIICIVMTFIFWFLDAYYLKMERQYRDLYNEVRQKKDDTDFEMNARKFKQCFCEALFSSSNFPLYLSVIVLLVGALLIDLL